MRSSILARIPGFRQRIIPEPSIPSRGSQARGTRLRIRHTEGNLIPRLLHRMSTRVTAATPWMHDSSSKCWCHGPGQCMFERHPPLDVNHFEYYQGGECLSYVHWLGPWHQHLMTNYRLRRNHRKIIGNSWSLPSVYLILWQGAQPLI
jgi:hypothetical protein